MGLRLSPTPSTPAALGVPHHQRDIAATYRGDHLYPREKTIPMWTATQVADLLNVRPSRVYELVRSHQIPFIKIGRRQFRFDPAAIQEWLDARTTQARVSEEQ